MGGRDACIPPTNRLRVSLAVSSLAAILCATAAWAHGAERDARALTCKAGATLVRVGGKPTCLASGQACSAKLQADYRRAGLVCWNGRLKRSSAAAKTATTTRESPAAAGTRANPIPLNTPGNLGNGWTLTITSVNSDATAAILAADPANASPLPGYRYVLVTVTASYNGAGSSHLSPAASLHAVGASNVEHSTANSFCGELPPPNLDLTNPLVLSGGSESGYAACWMVSAAEIASLEMYHQQPLTTTQVWFALH